MPKVIKPEFPENVVLITSRTSKSKLWFPTKPSFANFFCSALARLQERYKVIIYGFCLMGNHYHLVAQFPEANRASFERDLNSIIALSLKNYVSEFSGGRLWEKPYKFQLLPNKEDVENWFLYTILNPVSSGVTDYPFSAGRANSWAIIEKGGAQEFEWLDRTRYENARRKNPNVNPRRYISTHTLKVSRLPGYEDLSLPDYIAKLSEKIRTRRENIINERKASGKGFLGERKLACQPLGSKPKKTKRSSRYSYNPLVLSLCWRTKRRFIKLYLQICRAYARASVRFRQGDTAAEFPHLTYKPVVLTS